MDLDKNIKGINGVAKAFYCSSVAAVITRFFSYPFEKVMVLKMTNNLEIKNYNNHFNIINFYYKKYGIRNLYIGNMIHCLRLVPIVSIELYWYEKFKNLFMKINLNTINDPNLNKYLFFFSGFISSGLSLFLLFPMEFGRIRCILKGESNFKNLFIYLKDVYKNKGVKHFYHGSLYAFLWYSLNSGIRFSTYEFLKKKYYGKRENQAKNNNHLINSVFGATSCFLGLTISFPLDMFSKIKWKQVINKEKNIDNLKTISKNLYKSKGVLGFFNGLSSLMYVIPFNGLILSLNDLFKIKFNIY